MPEAFEFKVRVYLKFRVDEHEIWKYINEVEKAIENLREQLPFIQEITVLKKCIGLEIEP